MMHSNGIAVSEEYRLVARDWVEADAAARLLEETKSSVLAQRMLACHETVMSKREMIVKASPEWMEHLHKIVDAKTRANLLRVKLEWIKMKFGERMSQEATSRSESRL